MTLGAILMLGGATSGRGEDLSGSVTDASSASAGSLGGFTLPSLPQNWADSPIKLTAYEFLGYNSNIFAVPNGVSLPGGEVRGDFVNTTSFGGSTRAWWYGQQFFADGSYGVVRYLHQVSFDSNQYSFDAGVNWALTTRCTGVLEGLVSRRPTTLLEQVGVGINNLDTQSFSETAKCAFSNKFFGILNSGIIKSTNSNVIDQLNDLRTEFVTAGIEYTTDLSDLWVEATIRGTNYLQRTALQNAIGLANSLGENDLTMNYVRHVNPNLTLNGQIGATGITNQFSFAFPRSIVPHYLASVEWTPTPKLKLAASAS